MDSLILTKILFLFVFIAMGIYWIRSFSNGSNIIYSLPRWHRYPYVLGMIIIGVASINIFKSDSFSYLDLNMFLIGCIIMTGSTAFWDKHLNDHFSKEHKNTEVKETKHLIKKDTNVKV